jgi:FlaA1/EpsC-like NDP-sugar epimerase
MILNLLDMFSKRFKNAIAVLHDLLATTVVWLAAYWLRYNFEDVRGGLAAARAVLPWVLPIQVFIFWMGGLYKGLWRYASLADLKRLALVVGIAALAVPVVQFFVPSFGLIPRSVLVMVPALQLLAMGGSRAIYRMWREGVRQKHTAQHGQNVVILGAGDAAAQLIRDMRNHGKWNPVALLDDNPHKHQSTLHGLPIRGPLSDFAKISTELSVTTAVIAMPGAHHTARQRAAEVCRLPGVEVLTVPSLEEVMSGKAGLENIRKIEVEDLLGRDPVTLDEGLVAKALKGKVIMVTGAGGSIGSELCRQISRFKPSLLVCFELSEHMLYLLKEEFDRQHAGVNIVALTGDVKNAARVKQVIEQFRPQVVFHAAAYKHVPLMENGNAWEAVRNNALGTYTVAKESALGGVERFVLISTDKAVNPTNVMGATKRLAELICQSLQGQGKTIFRMVRFGNVLGSNGSVIPKFQAQIAAGGPITVTHPDIIRYFMSIPEAAQLVLQAASLDNHDDSGGEILVLDMGEPVRIVDLAKQLIKLSGRSESEIGIEITGLRPGEKLYEELLADGEQTLPTHHEKIRLAKASKIDPTELVKIQDWITQLDPITDEKVKNKLAAFIPEYKQSSILVHGVVSTGNTESTKVTSLRIVSGRN